jgi:flavin reductase (DIM6/NTAB) family NADH-FMN oxidoreductase RutF
MKNATAACLVPDPVAPGKHFARLDERVFRNALGRFACGVTVVTTQLQSRDFGSTVSAFTSVSLEPPLVLCCLNRASETGRVLLERNRFAVCLLASGQAALARRFAAPLADRFAGVSLSRTAHGLPIIAGCLAHLECRVAECVQAGDHVVVFGAVEGIHAAEGAPLVVYRGSYGSFQPEPPR